MSYQYGTPTLNLDDPDGAPADEFGVPMDSPPEKGKKNRPLIVLSIIVLIILCCCLVALVIFGYLGWIYGDMILEEIGINFEKLNLFT